MNTQRNDTFFSLFDASYSEELVQLFSLQNQSILSIEWQSDTFMNFRNETRKALAYNGIGGPYHGGGFSLFINPALAESQDALLQCVNELADAQFLDSGTRVIFVEFVVLIPGINRFRAVQIQIEFLASGKIYSSIFQQGGNLGCENVEAVAGTSS